jgi:predicted PurR-regulated permease PerM
MADLRERPGYMPRPEFIQRTIAATLIVVGIVLLLLLAHRLSSVLLLLFAGLLVAVFLRAIAEWLNRKTGLAMGWSLLVTIVLLLIGAVALGLAAVPRLIEEGETLAEEIPRSVIRFQEDIRAYPYGDEIATTIETARARFFDPADALEQAQAIGSALLGGIAGLVVVTAVALYLAADPFTYRRGILKLVPIERRPRAQEVFDACIKALASFIMGRILTMIAVGILAGLGLWILGVPLAFFLAVLAALLEFIPWVGPWLAAVPAILMAWTVSPATALYVGILYFVIQQLESYLLTPLAMRFMVKLPPVLTLAAIFAFGSLFGLLGILLAAPLAAVIVVLVKMLYVEDALGDRSDPAGERHPYAGESS